MLDNYMIGANSIIMYNTQIGPDAIVAAGAVITQDVPSGEIWGVPARKIGNIDDLARKRLVMINERESIGNFTDLQR